MLSLFLVWCLCIVPSWSQAVVTRLNLTPTGPEVSRIAYGTLHMAEAQTPERALVLIENALSLGITTFDLSDVYAGGKCLTIFGQAINLKPGLRAQMELIAKMDVYNGYDTSREHLEAVMATFLDRLKTDYLDMLFLHRQDYLMDVAEVSKLFYEWKAAGKVRYFGLSNHDQNSFLNLNARIPLVTNEIEVSVWAPDTICPLGSGPVSTDPYLTNNGLVDFHYRLNSSVFAWGPLGGDPYGGINRLFKKEGARQTQVRKALAALGQVLVDEEDVIALAWLLKHPANIIPIIGTMNAERMVNQTRAEAVAQKMTRKQWYDVARGIGVPIP